LETITANNNPGGTYRSNNTNNTVVGGSAVSLRTLGPNATLVLLNGRRMAFYGFSDQSSFVDLGSIPMSAIERVEIVKDGASAIYGSDALAGVVNFILRNNYSGVDLRVSAGGSQSYGGKGNQTATLTAGSVGNGLNLMGILEVYNQAAVQVTDRQGGRQAERTAAALKAGYTNASLLSGNGIGGMFPATSSSNGNWYSNNPSHGGAEEYYSAGVCNAPNVLYTGTYNGYPSTKQCLDTETDRFNTLWPQTKKLSAFGRATYDFSPTLSAFGEISVSENKQVYDYWPVFKNDYYDIWGSPGIAANFPIAQAPEGWGYYARLYDELGKRQRDVTSRSSRLVAGLKGESAGWDWEAALTQSNNRTDFLGTNYVNVKAWDAGLANGSINPFKTLTAANIEALRTIHTRNGDSSFTLIDGKASGEVATLPAGPVMLAVGVNLRVEKMSDGIDAPSNAGFVEGASVRLPITASRNSDAVYAELSVPLHKTIETQVALRRDNSNDFGSSVNPKLAMKWTPSSEFALRGSYSTGFRAPSLAEIHGGTRFYTNCPITLPHCPKVRNPSWGDQATVVFGDSPDLKPEKSTSGNIGAIWEPVKNHSIGIDFWSVERSDQVYGPNLGNAADGAYFTMLSPASNAAPTAFAARYTNLGKTLVQGVDIGVASRWMLGEYGNVRVSLNSSNMKKYSVESRGVTVENVGTYGYPAWRHRADVAWTVGTWTTALAANYRGQFDQAIAGPNGKTMSLDSFATYDLYVSYRGFGKGLTLSGSVRNILGTTPPFDMNGRLGTLYEDDSERRSVSATLDYKF
jgi:iron complex outermembrane receptor protein